MHIQTQNYINHMMRSEIIPGAVFGFIKNNTIKQYTIGNKQLVPEVKPMSADTQFDIASLTKVIGTNTVLLKLLQEKKIRLDDPLKKYLPNYQDKYVTLKQLLTHTSGINGFIPNRNRLSQADLIQAFYGLKSEPRLRGKEVVYTDTGTILIGLMLENIYGKSVQSIIEEEVLIPLELKQTGFNPSPEKTAPTELKSDRGLIHASVHDTKAFILKEHCGSAGLFSTIGDLFRFCHMMLHYGETKNAKHFLKKETIDYLNQNHTADLDKSRSIGWDLKFHPLTQTPILYHTGYTGTFMLIDLLHQEAFVFLSNRVHPVDNKDSYLKYRDALVDTYLQELTLDTYQTKK